MPDSIIVPDQFRAAFARLTGSVSVITIVDGQQKTGLTVTSVVSLSAEPPRLLFVINPQSSSWPLLRRSGGFAVQILAADQQAVADRFAGRNGESGAERFADAQWLPLASGNLALRGSLATLDCHVVELVERSDHVIVIGQVRQLLLGDDQVNLLYRQRGYFALTPAR